MISCGILIVSISSRCRAVLCYCLWVRVRPWFTLVETGEQGYGTRIWGLNWSHSPHPPLPFVASMLHCRPASLCTYKLCPQHIPPSLYCQMECLEGEAFTGWPVSEPWETEQCVSQPCPLQEIGHESQSRVRASRTDTKS